MNFQKPAVAAALSLIALTASVPSWGAVLLTSSHLSMDVSATARVFGDPVVNTDDIVPASTLITSFNDSLSVTAEDADIYDDWGDVYTIRTVGSADSALSVGVETGATSTLFDIRGEVETLGVSYDWNDAYGWAYASGTASLYYEAQFTLTSSYAYDWSSNLVYWDEGEAYDHHATAVLLSLASPDTVYYEAGWSWGHSHAQSGVLGPGDYTLLMIQQCTGTATSYFSQAYCSSDLDANLLLTEMPSAVPIAPALPLLASGLVALVGFAKRKAKS